jgi:membrane protease YdiL (CAAX protease family)
VTDRTPLSRFTSAVLWVGTVLFWLVLYGLKSWGGFELADAILSAVLLVVLPALAIAQAPLMADANIDRLPAYWSSIATLWILGTLGWLVGTRDGGPSAIGFVWTSGTSILLWSAALTVVGLVTIFSFRSLSQALGIRETRIIRELLPRTSDEKGVFLLLSMAAGIGEEVAYRGYALPVLIPLLGSVGAVSLTAGVFGLLHVYQGTLGIFRTAVMGGFLAWGFLASGSLIPPMIAHTIIDILAGLVLAERLLLPPDESGVDLPEPPPQLSLDR